MRFVFFGTPEFAAVILNKLVAAGFAPAAVVCNPDRAVGRKKVITKPPTKALAEKHTILVFQPEDLDANLKSQISNLKPDFFIIAAYAKIIPKEILDIPRLGTIGVHPSLLPKYRGASPIQSAILNGEAETGVTLYLMDEKMDNGPIIVKSKIKDQISKITYEELLHQLAELGGDLLVETFPKFLAGEITPEPQDRSQATFTKKFTTDDGFVDPEDLKSAETGENPESVKIIDRKIRALNPEPGVWTLRQAQGKRVKLLEARLESGKLVLTKIQVEGEKPKIPKV